MNYLYGSDGRRVLYLTVREFAAYCKVTDRTVQNWCEWGMPNLDVGDDISHFRLVPAKEAITWVKLKSIQGFIRWEEG